MNKETKVLILGAGIVGVTTAYYLRTKGYDVKVVDAENGAAMATSFANGSQLSYSKTHPLSDLEILKRLPKLYFDRNSPIHIHPGFDLNFFKWGMLFVRECMPYRSKKNAAEVLQIGLNSRTEMHKLVQRHEMNFDYVRRGKMYVFTNEHEFEHIRKDIEVYRKYGIDQQAMTPAEAVAMEPGLKDMADKIHGVIYSSLDESGDAKKFTDEMVRICKEMGVEFEFGVRINGFKRAGNKVTAALAGERELGFDRIVCCLGPETPKLMKKLGIYVPIYPMKGYSITVPAGELVPEINITDEEKRVVYTKIGDRLRIAGVAEFAGYDYSINRDIINGMINAAKERFPRAGDYSKAQEWTALRPMTPSTVPIIGKSDKIENLYFNTGHGMLGWTLALGSAEKLAKDF